MTKTAQFRFAAVATGLALSGILSVTPAFASTYPVASQGSNYYSNLVCDRYSPTCLSQQWSYVNSQYSSSNYTVGSNGVYGYAPSSTYGYSAAPSYGYSSYPSNSYSNSYYPSYSNSNYSNGNYGYTAPNGSYYPITTIYGSTPSNYSYQYQYQYQYAATPSYANYSYSTPSYSAYKVNTPNYSYNSYPSYSSYNNGYHY